MSEGRGTVRSLFIFLYNRQTAFERTVLLVYRSDHPTHRTPLGIKSIVTAYTLRSRSPSISDHNADAATARTPS